MQGNAHPYRTIGSQVFYDPLSKLEDPTSQEALTAVANEQTRWRKALSPLQSTVKSWETLFQATYASAMPAKREYASEILAPGVYLQHASGHRLNIWLHDKRLGGLTDFGIHPHAPVYFTIRDVGNGDETYELSVYNQAHERLWHKTPVGPVAVFHEDTILYQTVDNQLRYPGICVADRSTGTSTQIFDEQDKRYQIDLIQPPYQSYIFLRRENALQQRLAIYDPNTTSFHWFTPPNQHQSIFPITKDIYATDTTLFVRHKPFPLLPNEFFVDALLLPKTILYTTTHMAKMSLYAFDLHKQQIRRIWGKDFPCDIKLRKYAQKPTIEIGYPHKASELYTYQDNTLKRTNTFLQPINLSFRHGLATSKDGTKVPYTLVFHKHTQPEKLFVEGYGSYGISSRRSYPISRLAWIERGYAYVVSFARGGREDGDRWWDGGRTALRKQNTFDDTAAVIQTVQAKYGFSPNKTVFYGRSAGGLLAANIAHQYPHLIQAVYTEVPYLDVIRTTTNPNLPLTQMEYDEFGDPSRRPEELRALQTYSPVDTVPPVPTNQPVIVVKTALHDSQVLPYETLKWAHTLRQHGWTVYAGIDGGGHFVEEKSLYRGMAEDATLVDQALSKAPPKAHTSTGTRRRKWSSSKHFTRHRTSSSAQ